MDAVIKIGGSLAESPEQLKALGFKLSELAKKYAVTVVPGGGRFADMVREIDRRFALSSMLAHRMAILGMDQYGLLLTQIIPNSVATYLLSDARQLSEIGAVPIFLPSRLMFKEDPLENSWDVTSDSIAAYVASRLGAAKLLLVTDVDGIFTEDPKQYADAALIERSSTGELLRLNKRTSVDRHLPKLLLEMPMDCYVVNGNYPERVAAILDGQHTVCTFIAPRK
ncbi:MAG: delta 1-pyrroline-5-carboxylate synthetase [Candidatus Bathyarchaeota archaeon]|nr:delta 1-pyrroline-5-carboxylate synthetase [Candidatus Bathyarchaeota archaeon]